MFLCNWHNYYITLFLPFPSSLLFLDCYVIALNIFLLNNGEQLSKVLEVHEFGYSSEQ